MKLRIRALGLFAALASLLIPPPAVAKPATNDAVDNKGASVYPFDLTQVKLLAGPFQHAQELNRQYLRSLEPDRLLHTFRLNAGLPSTAQPLGGWEHPEGELRGHFTGHYLTACALMYASTGDEILKQNAAHVVKGLAECQAQNASGYVSAYPEEFFDRVESGKPVWAPYYTLHKIYAGLLDVYVHCDNAQALEVCRKFADWLVARNDRLSDEQMQAMLNNEHGGMNEVLANLYAVTGEQKYLTLSRRFNHMAVIGPAIHEQDRLTGLHANTQVPKFVGTARQFELTGDPTLKTASKFFWDTVVQERSYVIGGHSDGEYFSPKERMSTAFGPATTETCNTYNMLKLTQHLFGWDPDARYADYYERAIFNHILASQHPDSGMMCYYVPLRSGSAKGGPGFGYSTPLDSFWCCTGTGIENHAKYGDSIYFHDGGTTLYVNLFIASELNWEAKGLRIRQDTRFPEEESTQLTIHCQQPTRATVKVRHPAWATSGLTVVVNGEKQSLPSEPGSYIGLEREWRDGDQVEVQMPFHLATEGFADNPDRFAILNGPIVLCAEVDRAKTFPAILAPREEVTRALRAVEGKANTFTSPPDLFRIAGSNEPSRVTLEPFYQMHGDRRYVVYWDRFSPEQWAEQEQAYREAQERQAKLDALVVDAVAPGEQQSETDHRLQGEETSSGDFDSRKYRHSVGGWFSYELKVLPDTPQELWVTYWGSDGGKRTFDILVDGETLVTQSLERQQPDKFFDEATPLPTSMIEGKEKITVKFAAHPDNCAGGVFGVRVMKQAR